MTNSIIISDISIRQDAESRYSLNDLHKAAGSESRHAPSQWLRLDQVNELIHAILNMQICTIKPVDSHKGRYGGTYVCKELVYAYATWISAEFFLKVISAYDALVSGNAEKADAIAKTSTDERTPLRGLVNRIMGKTGIHYQPLYKMIHREFGVNHIDELTPKQVAEAMGYLASKVLEGELLPKDREPGPFQPAMPHSASRVMLYLDEKGVVIGSLPLQEDQVAMSFEGFISFAKQKGMVVIPREELEQRVANLLA